MKNVPCLINGIEIETRETFQDIDPSIGEKLADIASGGFHEIGLAVQAARDANTSWANTSPQDRALAMRSLAELIRRDEDQLALWESRDTGKPLSQAHADAQVAARYFEFYANLIDAFFGRVIPTAKDITAYTSSVPFGVTGHIIPWNYPLQIASRTIAPALATGNCCVVKPAEEAPITVLMLGLLALEAGIPEGALNVVPGLGEDAGAALAGHPGVDHLSFTGSVETGKVVSRLAAENVIPVALELGGKSPNIVLSDADLNLAAPAITRSIVQNAGQTCSAGSRLLVHESVHDALVELLVEIFSNLRIGPGPDDPDLGPLISESQQLRVAEFVDNAGKPKVGGRSTLNGLPKGGFYYPATLIDNVDPTSDIAQEEVFGPVVAVISFADITEAVRLANSTAYGLIAAIWTRNLDDAHRVASEVTAGQIYINTYGAGGGVEFPFGGFGKSGYGREKGFEALGAFTQTKTTIVKHLLD